MTSERSARYRLENWLAHARVLGARVIETCVLAANVEGVRFAEARGFVEIDRYVLDGENDLWLDLRREPSAT